MGSTSGVVFPFMPGVWHHTGGIIGSGTVTITVSPNQGVVAPAPVNVEVVYFDGIEWHRTNQLSEA
jgi:hypothetical protein